MVETEIECPPDMLLIPGGIFLYGNDLIARHVDAFFCDRDPVTCAQYGEYLRATRRPAPAGWPPGRVSPERADLPIVNVTFDEATAYASWAKKALPSELQWEKAARGTDGRKYPWGARVDVLRTNVRESAHGSIVAVSELHDESPFLIRGTSGNVYQWTTSVFSAARRSRVIRGGSFRDFLGSVAWRHEMAAERATETVGFRCVRSLPPAAAGTVEPAPSPTV